MMNRTSLALVAVSLSTPLAWAHPGAPEQSTDPIWQGREKVGVIMPVFGQLVRTSIPKGFQLSPVFEKVEANRYTQETVLIGENVDTWTQMITIGSVKDLASNPEATASKIANNIAGGYKKACPDSFSAAAFPTNTIDQREAFVAVMSCGTSPLTQGRTSEAAVLVVLKGDRDYYTFKWSERSAPSSTPIAIDVPKWTERVKRMMPFQLCPIVSGEQAPYPSCIDKKPSQASG